MKNKFKLVETEKYTLAVFDKEVKEGDYIFDNYAKINLVQQVRKCDFDSSHYRNGNWKKIIAYQPKGNAKELDLPLLPYAEDDVEKLAESYYTQITLAERTAFKFGYKAATKVYSEEDLKKMFAYAHQVGMNTLLQTQSPHLLEKQDEHKLRDGFIQSLKQPKWFVAEIECGEVMQCDCSDNESCLDIRFKTTTINNKIYLEGIYLFE